MVLLRELIMIEITYLELTFIIILSMIFGEVLGVFELLVWLNKKIKEG